MRAATITLSFSLALAPLGAQDVGSQAPELTFVKTYGFDEMPQQKLSDLRGSVVLLAFWHSASQPCRREIPRLNELHVNFAKRGLVVLGVTDEAADKVDPYVARNDIRYPVVIRTVSADKAKSEGEGTGGGTGESDGEGERKADYQIKEVPHAFLIDQAGKIAWRGHPARLDTGQLDAQLAGARPATVRAGLEDVYQLRSGGQHGQAYKLIQKLRERSQLSEAALAQADGWCEVDAAFVAAAVAEADAAEKAKDIYLLWSRLDLLARQYDGVPGAESAGERLQQLMASKQNQEEVEAGQRFEQAQRMETALDYDGAIATYLELSRSHRRTRAGKNAKIRHRDLLKAGMLGFDATCAYCKAGGSACPTHLRKK